MTIDTSQLVDDLLKMVDVRLATLKASRATDSLTKISADYRQRIEDSITEYLASDKASTSYRNAFRRAAAENFDAAFWRGYLESAGEIDEADADAQAWLAGRLEAELGFIGELFVSLKQLRDQFWRGEVDADALRAAIQTRVTGYLTTLESVYTAGRMFGGKNKMVTWYYGDTEHCDTCRKLNGARHRVSWFLARDYIPRQPGAAMDCGGYRCQCRLEDDAGHEITP